MFSIGCREGGGGGRKPAYNFHYVEVLKRFFFWPEYINVSLKIFVALFERLSFFFFFN